MDRKVCLQAFLEPKVDRVTALAERLAKLKRLVYRIVEYETWNYVDPP